MKKKQVKDFFKFFIKDFLVSDILILNEIKKDEVTGLGACTIPQALTVLSGIDLLGLLFGNNKNINATEKHFADYYRIIKDENRNNQYDEDSIQKLVLYRHGMMHNFFPKFQSNNVGICKSESENLFIKESFGDIEIVSLNVSILTTDFLLAVSLLEKMILESSDDSFFDNILDSIKDLGYSNQLAITTTTETTINIVTQNKKITPTKQTQPNNTAQV